VGDDAVPDGRSQHRPDVVDAGADGPRREAALGHLLDPLLDVGSAQLDQRQLREGHACGGEVHREDGRRLPHLPGGPFGVEGLEGDPTCLGIDVLTRDHAGRHLVEPALRVELAGEVP
jgi:hypothetical protein